VSDPLLALDHPLPLRLLLDEAMRQVRRHFRTIYLPVAIPLALFSSLMPFTQSLWMGGLSAARDPTPEMLAGLAVFVLVALLFFLFYILANGAMVVGAVEALAGREVSMSRAWKTLLRPKVFGTLVLTWVFTVAGFACCLLPGVFLMLRYAFVVPVMVEEGRFGWSALGRSVELTRHNPRNQLGTDPRVHVFLILFVGFLIAYAAAFVVQTPLIFVQQLLIMRAVAEGRRMDPAELMASMTWIQVPAQVLGTLAQTAVQLYVSFALGRLFFDVRRRREGGDLEAAVLALERRAGLAPPEPEPER
jgi:hypothetical protein